MKEEDMNDIDNKTQTGLRINSRENIEEEKVK